MRLVSSSKAVWRDLALTALFLLLSQVLFWPPIHLAEKNARPAQMDQRSALEFVAVDASGALMFGGKRFSAKRDGNQGYYAPLVKGSAQVRFFLPFEWQESMGPQAFYLSIRSDAENIRINDLLIQAELPTERQRGDVNNEPGYYPIPPSALRTGANLITLESKSFGAVHDLGLFAIGDAGQLFSSYRWKSLLVIDLPVAGIAILLFTALLCFLVNWPAEDRPRIRSLEILLLLSAATTAILTLSPQAQMPLWLTIGLYAAASFAMGLASIQYASRDGGYEPVSRKWVRRAWLAIPVIVSAALGMVWWQPDWTGFGYSWLIKISFYVQIGLGTVASVILAWITVRQHWRLWAERLVLILCLSFFSLDRIASMAELYSPFDPALPLTLPWSPIVGVFLGMAMVISLARQAGEARRTVTQSNAILAARLIEQDAELAASYDAQKLMMQRQVMLEERQRIVRDMHDGIGGQLLGLMMQVRSGGAEPKQVEEGLQSSIADLRLIVDSMDSAEDGMAETLRSFEHRVRAQVEAAGIALTVRHGLPDGMIGHGPRPTLQILRILQEAVSNALRHSGASEITLDSHEDAGGLIAISITDNGTGLPDTITGGRGLTSMRSRAVAVGGALEIESAPGRTALILTLPKPAAAIG